MKRITLEEFIERAKVIHGDKYDYSKTVYINNYTPVEIICPIHGSFWQQPNHHLRKSGCVYCVNDNKRKLFLKTTENFINEANKIHENKYDYSETFYEGAFKPIKIRCKEHGIFIRLAKDHLRGKGCPECEKPKHKNHSSKEKFIEKAQFIHGNIFNYDLVDYKTNTQKVKIICKKHGIFLQTPKKHLEGSGCPKCKTSKGERYIIQILEKNKINYVYQKRFFDCVDKTILPFDFYLPDYNLCIEYQGIQHYKPICRSKNKEDVHKEFEKIKYHDNLKQIYCSKRGIELLLIPYFYDTIKKLDNLLLKYLKK